ncbi:MAG: response regulator transcription factor [Pseudomonadota bacterium]
MNKRVLVVEDDPDFGDLIRLHLESQRHEVTLANDGIDGLAQARRRPFDLAILDDMLPGLEGTSICQTLRSEAHYLPIIMLTARSGEADRVRGLEVGADDYLTKPCSMSELMARVRAMLRRMDYLTDKPSPGRDQPICRGDLMVDPVRRYVRLGSTDIRLTAREFDLLHYLAARPGRVYSRKQLLDDVWGIDRDALEHTVNAHINRLRAKIESLPTKPERILTVWGVGYKFSEH